MTPKSFDCASAHSRVVSHFHLLQLSRHPSRAFRGPRAFRVSRRRRDVPQRRRRRARRLARLRRPRPRVHTSYDEMKAPPCDVYFSTSVLSSPFIITSALVSVYKACIHAEKLIIN